MYPEEKILSSIDKETRFPFSAFALRRVIDFSWSLEGLDGEGGGALEGETAGTADRFGWGLGDAGSELETPETDGSTGHGTDWP